MYIYSFTLKNIRTPYLLQDIVNRVKNGESIPYRPSNPETDPDIRSKSEVLVLMERCWKEDPLMRPTFGDIKKIFKAINKGKWVYDIHVWNVCVWEPVRCKQFYHHNHRNFNIMDNMISMMEKYASNLEGLVQQRTGELLDEKKKTDLLLNRMLPPYG